MVPLRELKHTRVTNEVKKLAGRSSLLTLQRSVYE